ncbi:MAG: mannose-6-phosphate isomerase, class I [Chloroflexi bacterium]|mgnify:CR=1 FL=1|nr:mannose-6-phosphate isomerase, class I [Chloroflexota bacterium]
MTSLELRPYRLFNNVQHYAWGARGGDALIPKLLGITPEQDRPYAELWIGAHAKAPSDVAIGDDRVPLDQLIHEHPDFILGAEVSREFGGRLPFLLKVLSAVEPLSIQAHPDRRQAEVLHVCDPEHYPDDRHKPEISVALDSLDALVGFRPLDDLNRNLRRHPELSDFVGRDVVSQTVRVGDAPAKTPHESVRVLVEAMVKHATECPDDLGRALDALQQRLMRLPSLDEEERLFLELRCRYPGPDIGLFCVFLLNRVRLNAGQGLYIGPGIPHAYLRGNIVECMANSDNVVRIGLTDKFRDAGALRDILTYETGQVSPLETVEQPGSVTFCSPASEFLLSRHAIAKGGEWEVSVCSRPQVMVVLQGKLRVSSGSYWESFARGEALLIPAALRSFVVWAEEASEVYRVTVPVK